MLELAHAWSQTKDALDQARRDIEELPRRVASEHAKLVSRDGHSNVHIQNLVRAQRDLDHAKALAPELEKQLHDLEQQYHDSGYDEVPYATWTPGETRVGGRGIAEVGRAVAMGGTPAGLQSTGIEFDIVSAALAGPAILRLGKAVLKRGLGRATNKTPLGPRIEPPPPAKEVIPGRGGPYGHFEDPPNASSGLDFTPSQKRNILNENARRNDGVLIDDRSGDVLVPGQQRRRGVPAPPNEAQVDHIYPKSKGGPNTYSNAEVRSRLSNIRKGKKLE